MPQAVLNAVLLAALVCAAGAASPAAARAEGLVPATLRCEGLVDPIGVDEPHPHLSWTLQSPDRGARQTAYRIVVASTAELLEADKPDLWDSGKVASVEQNQIEYGGKELASRQPCVWRVRAWDASGHAGPWSAPAAWEVGLRDPADWHAQWVGDPAPKPAGPLDIVSATYAANDGSTSRDVTDRVRAALEHDQINLQVTNDALGGEAAKDKHKHLVVRYTVNGGAPVELTVPEHDRLIVPARAPQVLRQTFTVDRPIVRARLYATALGIYALQINGRPTTDAVFTPDWTDYRKRVRYQAYDVTPLVRQGTNAIAGSVADGFYCGHIGNGGYQFWGVKPAVRAQLELTFADGSVQRVATDASWQAHAGPLRAADVMNGEAYDARAAFDASAPDLADDHAWSPVEVKTDGLPPSVDPQVAPFVRELMTLTPRSVSEPTPGHWLFDMGQNMVGVARIRVAAPAGTAVTIRFAEMLNPNGTIYTDNYRGARSTDTYVCRGGGVETWQPSFTYHGFRYVELTGLSGHPSADNVTGIVQGSDTPSTGTFTCSDPRINQLWSNIRWGQRGNFFGVPTDCPQRDERLGWMGDAQVFVGTAVYNADVSTFFDKWLVDVDDEQRPGGQFTNTAPNPAMDRAGAPGWAEAGVICPWTIYRTYGDPRVLTRHLPAMMRYVDWLVANTTGLIRVKDRGSDFGDWLAIGANTSKELLGTAYFAHAADLVSRSAKAVGDEKNAAKYADLFEHIKAAFRERYVLADGSIKDGTQTAYALALSFDLLPEADRPAAAGRLAADVQAKGDHLSTGFLGVSYLLPVLSNNNQTDTAFRLLMQDTFPSWLFSIRQGATTIWERWDGWTPDKGFQDKGMNSFNHYSLGSCGYWLYASVAGIAQPKDGVGFSHVTIQPLVGGGLTSAAATYDSIRGPIRAAWQVKDGRFTLDVVVPPNVTASVRLPATTDVQESGRPVAEATDVHADHNAAAAFEIGSGTYHFSAAKPR